MRLMGFTEVSNGRVSDLIFHTMSLLTNSREWCQGPDALTLADHIDQDHISCSKRPDEWIFYVLVHFGYFWGLWMPSCSARPPIYFPWDLMSWTQGASWSPHPSSSPSGIIWFDPQWLTHWPFYSFFFHSPYVLGAPQQPRSVAQLCKAWCGLSLLKPNCFLNIVGLCIIAYVLHMVLEDCCCISFFILNTIESGVIVYIWSNGRHASLGVECLPRQNGICEEEWMNYCEIWHLQPSFE